MSRPIRESTPRKNIEAACARRGTPQVVAACLGLIDGGDADPDLIAALGRV